jgi:hypothetical protein
MNATTLTLSGACLALVLVLSTQGLSGALYSVVIVSAVVFAFLFGVFLGEASARRQLDRRRGIMR